MSDADPAPATQPPAWTGVDQANRGIADLDRPGPNRDRRGRRRPARDQAHLLAGFDCAAPEQWAHVRARGEVDHERARSHVGEPDGLSWRPRGGHRLEPGLAL